MFFLHFQELFEIMATPWKIFFGFFGTLMVLIVWWKDDFPDFQLGDSFPISLAPPGSSLELAPGSTLAEKKNQGISMLKVGKILLPLTQYGRSV